LYSVYTPSFSEKDGVYTEYMRGTGESFPENVPSRKEEVAKGKGFRAELRRKGGRGAL
jgi:hypothetical protein